MREVFITTDFIKLDGLLKFSGICASGGEAKDLISEGQVMVNGTPCTMRGKKCRDGDTVLCNGDNLLLRRK